MVLQAFINNKKPYIGRNLPHSGTMFIFNSSRSATNVYTSFNQLQPYTGNFAYDERSFFYIDQVQNVSILRTTTIKNIMIPRLIEDSRAEQILYIYENSIGSYYDIKNRHFDRIYETTALTTESHVPDFELDARAGGINLDPLSIKLPGVLRLTLDNADAKRFNIISTDRGNPPATRIRYWTELNDDGSPKSPKIANIDTGSDKVYLETIETLTYQWAGSFNLVGPTATYTKP